MKILFSSAVWLIIGCCVLGAQQMKNVPHIHREGTQIEELSYFLGSWKLTAHIDESAVSEGGEFRQAQTVEWMKGEHFLISRSTTSGPLGDTFRLVVTGFDPSEKRFVYHSFQSTGASESGTGSLKGKVWTWVSEPPKQDVRLQRRVTLTELTSSKYSFALETTNDGKNWTTVMHGEAEKQPQT